MKFDNGGHSALCNLDIDWFNLDGTSVSQPEYFQLTKSDAANPALNVIFDLTI